MNIKELVQYIDNQELSEAKPKVKQDAQGNWVDAASGQPVQAPAGQVVEPPAGTFPGKPADAPAAGPTGDPVLDQPIDPAAPKQKKTMAQRIGSLGKAVGAIPGAWQGVKTAYQKGKADMATKVGGPVNAPAGGARQSRAGAAASGRAQQGGGAGDAEVNDLRQLINRLDARLTAAGIKETKKSVK